MGSSTGALFPSLHINLAECYRKLGDDQQARAQLQRAQQTVDYLPDDDYGVTIRSAITDVARRLA